MIVGLSASASGSGQNVSLIAPGLLTTHCELRFAVKPESASGASFVSLIVVRFPTGNERTMPSFPSSKPSPGPPARRRAKKSVTKTMLRPTEIAPGLPPIGAVVISVFVFASISVIVPAVKLAT